MPNAHCKLIEIFLAEYSAKGTGARIKLQLCHFLWPWASYASFLSLIQLICKTEINGVLENAKDINKLSHCVCVWVGVMSCPTLWSHRLQPARLFCPWNFPGNNTGMGCHFVVQGIFMTQGVPHISCVSCTGRPILDHYTTWETYLILVFNNFFRH